MRTLKNLYHWAVAIFFELWYGRPSRKLKVIGITGTDGKTTTSSLLYHVLKHAGKKVSAITTVAAYIGDTTYETGFHVTTPDPHKIPFYLAKAVADGDEYFILETTSHALDQKRIAGIHYTVSGITNITPEHLHYHCTFEAYVRAKSTIAARSDLTFINADQPDVVALLKSFQPQAAFDTFALTQQAHYMQDFSKILNTPIEAYNKYNYLLAYAIADTLGIGMEAFVAALQTFTPPAGRMQVLADSAFTVISDFAHTPNALHAALSAIKKHHPAAGRIIHVFGAAAFRDDQKRPAMGAASAAYADVVILTEEDYRTEDPEHIWQMIEPGLIHASFTFAPPTHDIPPHSYTHILNREEAIAYAIAIAKPSDVVVITGKGQEKTLCRGKKEYPYDEATVVQQALAKKKASEG